MSNDLEKSLRKAMNRKYEPRTFEANEAMAKKHRPPAVETNEATDDNEILSIGESSAESKAKMDIGDEQQEADKRKKRDRPLKLFGWLCMAVFVVSLMLSPVSSVDTSEAAQNALVEKVSTSLPAGTVLLSSDQNIGRQDYTIVHNYEQKDTRIWVWDYAAEDGDYVQVLVNGAPAGDAFMIKHKPVEITVPAAGEVQIKGIRDGGGGITYAVRYDLNGTNYFNSAPEGQFNTYTLIRE